MLLSYVSAEDAAAALVAAFGDELKAVPLRDTRQLVVSGPRRLVDSAIQLAAQLDEPPLQVVIGVALVNSAEGLPAELKKEFDERAEAPNPDPTPRAAGVSSLPMSRILEIVEADENATVLSYSQVATVEGKPAVLTIGEKQLVAGASAGTSEDDSVDTGLELQVTPIIDTRQQIALDLSATLSALAGHTPDKQPIVSTRTTKMSLRLRDGQTALVGALLTHKEIQEFSKIPVLGQLPFVGRYFRKHRVSAEESGVVLLLLSPRIVRQ